MIDNDGNNDDVGNDNDNDSKDEDNDDGENDEQNKAQLITTHSQPNHHQYKMYQRAPSIKKERWKVRKISQAKYL